MLQVPFIRQNTALVLERLALKNFKELHLVEEILRLDDDRVPASPVRRPV